MLLLDSLYINSGGGKILLKLIVEYLYSNFIDTHFLFDERVRSDFDYIPIESKTFCAPSIIRRHLFYKNNSDKFTSVLVFNNIPPTVKLTCTVYTYFHNILYLNVKYYDNFPLFLKSKVIRFFIKNTNKWVVQSNFVKNSLCNSWDIKLNDVLILPIFDDSIIKNHSFSKSKKNSRTNYLYVSDGHAHKNHLRLFEAFEKYHSLDNSSCTLVVTISNLHIKLKQRILNLIQSGLPIIDIGFVSQNELTTHYLNADVIIYPSLQESFGLGLIEATKFNLPIMASNLPYVYEVVEPNITFDPFSSHDIYSAFVKSKQIFGCKSKIISENKIYQLIQEIK
jgi:glycosyltransferase involved in cell wall biosynthesis